MAYKKINETTRAIIVAHLFAGILPAQISEETGVSEATISRLKRKIPEEVLKRFESDRQNIETERAELESEKNSIPILIGKHLEASLKACAKIMDQAQDDEWRNRHSASELAAFYRVASDKAFRILEAIEQAHARREALESQNNPSSLALNQHESV